MKISSLHLSPVCLSIFLTLGFASFGRATDAVGMNIPAREMAQKAGLAESLKDPSGASHAHLAVAGKVGVVIFSVPDMSQGPAQRRWSNLLTMKPESTLPVTVALVLVENMAEAGPFRNEARDDMKDQFGTRKRPFLLLDETGATFKRYGIPRDKTEILIFDRAGTLRDVEENLGDRETTLPRIKAITDQLSKGRG